MPTYEYTCRSCEERIEVVQSFSDDPLTVCEACGGELRKVFSAAGLIFKGSGWHIKDYSSGAKGGTSTSATAKDAAPKDAAPKESSAKDSSASSSSSPSTSSSTSSSSSSTAGSSD